MSKHTRPENRVRKHHNDHAHSKTGWVGGNPRYDRRHPLAGRSMGRSHGARRFPGDSL